MARPVRAKGRAAPRPIRSGRRVGAWLAWAGLSACADAGIGPDPDAAPGEGRSPGSASPAAASVSVCDRTPQVRDALAAAAGEQDCAAVTGADLAEVTVLELFNRSISSLQPGDFQGLARLHYLFLDGNRLVALPQQLFADVPALATLSLADNRLANLPAGTFAELRALASLSLRGNRIARVKGTLFAGLGALETLDLAGNGISALPDDLAAHLGNLRELDLQANELDGWPADALRRFGRLERLNLRANRLAELPAGAFARAPALISVSLAQNQLSALPAGLLRRSAALESLDLSYNRLASLPDSFFAGTGGLASLRLANNPGSPFRVLVELERTDSDDNATPGPARVRAKTRLGAPFAMDVGLSASGGSLSAVSVRFEGGRTTSAAVTAVNAAGSSFSVSPVAPPVPGTSCLGLPCYEGLRVDEGPPIVLANPPAATLSVSAVYLVQAAQTRAGNVPLVAGRRALLRVFARSDSANAFRPAARAVFYRDGAEAHAVALAPPPAGIPRAVREGDLAASFNAEVPGTVLQPGTEMVVELDPGRELPLASGSVRRVPAEGRAALDVRPVPPLDLTVVPVQYVWDANAGTNARVVETARGFAGSESSARLRFVKALLPVGDVRVRVRDPYFTSADTTELGAIDLLLEMQLLRHVEAGATREFYHGIFAVPRFAHVGSGWGLLGVAFQPGWVGLSRSHAADGAADPEFELTMAHEVGHNLSLGHAPCGNPLGVDEDFPYARASTGVFGYEFPGPAWPARVLDPALRVDLMSYCRPYWISDYNFVKALDYRAALAVPAAPARTRPPRREQALLLRGASRDGRLRLAPPLAWEAPPKLPNVPGPYRLVGAEANGAELFSFSFSPDEIDHGGRGFFFSVPLQAGWRDRLHSVAVHGPEGQAVRDMGASASVAVFSDPATGRIRGIASGWRGPVPPVLRSGGRPVAASPGWPGPAERRDPR